MRLHDYLSDVPFIAYSPALGRLFTPTSAILLCWVIWKSKAHGQFVEATVAEISAETGLSEKNIETAKAKLEGVLVVTQKRLEHRTFYSIDADELEKRWTAFRESPNRPFERKQQSDLPESPNRPFEVEKRTSLRTEELPPNPLAGGKALGASTPRKRCPKAADPTPQAKAIVQAFAETYGRHFRSTYLPNARKDVPGAEALALAGVTVEAVRERADAAMRSKAFNCRRATTVALLAELWNQIGGELQDSQRREQTVERFEETITVPMLK